MEPIMDIVDDAMGGVRGNSLPSGRYWEAFTLALIAGILAALPVNQWMLGRNLSTATN